MLVLLGFTGVVVDLISGLIISLKQSLTINNNDAYKLSMIEKGVVLILLAASLFALGNAAIVYQRSYYLESEDRVNLERLIDDIDQLERDRLLYLTERLVTISKSDFGILLLLNREFRRAILWLGLSLASLLSYVLFMQVRDYLDGKTKWSP